MFICDIPDFVYFCHRKNAQHIMEDFFKKDITIISRFKPNHCERKMSKRIEEICIDFLPLFLHSYQSEEMFYRLLKFTSLLFSHSLPNLL